ncbi:hypothetical protein SDC9_173550 [bioreactor metagenome]|uniref:Uncharacterized protein n=1 Tax=bioreactor metagenome TaxID=1076179 RepID=A0A645GIR9_9ZZZZ
MKSGNGNESAVFFEIGNCRSEFHFQLFGMFFNDGATFLNIIGDNSATIRNYASMTDDVILKNRDIRGSTSDVHDGNSCFFFLFG